MTTFATQECHSTQPTERTKICTGKCSSRSKNPKPKRIGEFMKDGKELSRCQLCRDREHAQKSRPEIKAKRAQNHHDKKPWQAYRERKKEELGVDGFRAHNNQTHQKWKLTYQDELNEWRRTSLPSQLCALKQSLDKRQIINTVSDYCLSLLMLLPCFFCGHMESRGFQTFARLDHRRGVEAGNVVSCCHSCIMMMKALDVNTFVKRCYHIAEKTAFSEVWAQDSQSLGLGEFFQKASARGMTVELNTIQLTQLMVSPCRYCKHQPAGGIDRKDNMLKIYSIDNCVPCCNECNCMKTSPSRNEIFCSDDEFIALCKRVANHYPLDKLFPSIPPVLHVKELRASSTPATADPSTSTTTTGGQVRIVAGPISDEFLQAEDMRRIAPDNIYEEGNLARARQAAKDAQAAKRQKTIEEVDTAKERVYTSKALPDGTPAPKYVSYNEKTNSVTLERRSKTAGIQVRITIPGDTWQQRVELACAVVGMLDAEDSWAQYNNMSGAQPGVQELLARCR